MSALMQQILLYIPEGIPPQIVTWDVPLETSGYRMDMI